jgi:hypothetical protein
MLLPAAAAADCGCSLLLPPPPPPPLPLSFALLQLHPARRQALLRLKRGHRRDRASGSRPGTPTAGDPDPLVHAGEPA